MKKFAYLTSLVLIVCSLFVFGCTNKYKNLRIELDKQEITLEVTEGQESFETVIATVKGAGKGVSTAVTFSTQSTNIILEQQPQVDNATECKIIANPNGTGTNAVVTVATVEGGKTKDISVNIVRKITSASANAEYKPAISLNGRLQINTGLAIKTVPENTTQKQFRYELIGTYTDVSVSESGELVVGSVMPTNNEIKVKAINIANSNVQVELSISVVKAVNLREQVVVKADGVTIDNLVIAPNIKSTVNLEFSTTLQAEENYYSYFVSTNSDILNIPTNTTHNQLNVTASKVGSTHLDVTVFVTGFHKQFASFTFQIPVAVKNVPTGITVTKLNNQSGANEFVDENDIVEVFDIYSDGTIGTKLTVALNPTPTEVEDSTFTIREVGATSYLNNIDILFSDETMVENLSELPSGVSIFFKLNKHTSLNESKTFQIEIVSNFNSELKQIVNIQLSKGISKVSVTENSVETNEIKIIKGETKEVQVYAKGSNNETLQVTSSNIQLDFGVNGAEYISANRDALNPALFTLTGNKCGETTISFFSNNGVTSEIKVIVYQPYTAFTANFAMPSSDIGEQLYYSSLDETDVNKVNSVKSLVFAVSASPRINISYYSDEEKQNVVTPTILDAYLTSSNPSAIAVFNKLYITGLKAKEIATITLHISSYAENGEIKTETIDFIAEAYVPLSQVQLNYNNLSLLDSETLSALNSSEGKAILELRMSPTNATFKDLDKVTWSVEGGAVQNNFEAKLNNEGLASNQVEVSVYLRNSSTEVVTITATVTQYTRSYSQSCAITVQKCEQIASIEIQNLKNSTVSGYDYDLYFNATKGLTNLASINDITANTVGQENFFNLDVRVTPANVTNGNVIYVVKNIDVNGNEITNADKDVVLVSSAGKVYANTAGYAEIHVIPADSLTEKKPNTATVIYNGKEYSYNEDVTKIIRVQVADGSIDNKIRIQSVSDFMGINTLNGLKLHYQLMSDLDFSNSEPINPIGYVEANNVFEIHAFTGSIDGLFTYGENEQMNFAITNLKLNMAAYNGAYVGLFANIGENAQVNNLQVYVTSITHKLEQTSSSNLGIIASVNNGTISNCQVNLSNLQAQNLAGEVKMGGIAGTNAGTISNCNVNGNIDLTYTTGIKQVSFGAVAGLNSGSISGMKVSTQSQTGTGNENAEFLTSFNFSDVDVMLNITTANPNIKTNGNEDVSAINYGGIVGINNGTVEGLTFGGVLKGYSKLGGIAGTNAGIISKCVNQGNVYSQGGSHIGGIAAHNTTGTIKNSGVQAFNYVGKNKNHTAIVGYNLVGAIAGVNAGTISDCHMLSYYSSRTATVFDATNSNYETDNLNGTGYYGDILVLGETGEYNLTGITTSNSGAVSFFVQTTHNETIDEIKVEDNVNTVPTSISASVKVENEIFKDEKTKISENALLLPYFETLAGKNLYSENKFNIADLISVSCEPEKATQKFIVQSSNTKIISLNNKGELQVLGVGEATLTISSIFNSCNSVEIKVLTSYPVGTLTYVNAAGSLVKGSLTLRKGQNALLTPTMIYKKGEVACKTVSNLAISAESGNTSYVTLNNTNFAVGSSIIISAKERTATATPINVTLTPSLKINETSVSIHLSEQIIAVTVSEGATDITFSQNNLLVSQTDVIEFIVYVNTDVALTDFSVNGGVDEKFEDLTFTDETSKLSIIPGAAEPVENENIIKVPFSVKLADPYQVFSENTTFNIVFSDKTLKGKTFTFTFTVKKQSAESVFANHYNGIITTVNTITYTELDNSNSITPGNTNILELDVYPFFSDIKEITVVNTGSSEDNVTFEQIIRTSQVKTTDNGHEYTYKSLFPRADYISNGIKVLPISKTITVCGWTGDSPNSSKITEAGTTYTHDGTNYLFDGKIYLKTLIKSGVNENSKYELTVTVKTINDVILTKVITLTAVSSLDIKLTYTYQMERGNASDTITETATESEDNAPIIYLPAGQENAGGILHISTIGFNGIPTLSSETTSGSLTKLGITPIGFEATISTKFYKVNNTTSGSQEIQVNNGTLKDDNWVTYSDNGKEYIKLSMDIPLANGTTIKKEVFLKFMIVDTVIPNLLIAKDPQQPLESVLPLETNGSDFNLSIYTNNWSGATSTATTITQSTAQNSSGQIDIAATNHALGKYWFVVDEDGKETIAMQYNNGWESNLSDSLEFTTTRLATGSNKTTHALQAKNPNTNQTLRCKFEYVYVNGILTLVKEVDAQTIEGLNKFTASVDFTTDIRVYNSKDLPIPIYSQTDFEAMTEDNNYILMQDIELTNYKPIDAKMESFNGNAFKIKVNFADYSVTDSSEMKDTLNLGLFNTVNSETTLKNVKVVINNIKTFNLEKSYRSVNFGTIAAVNNGVITNCSVSFEDVKVEGSTVSGISFTETSAESFKLEFLTDESVQGDLVNNIGGLVAINNGYITNSRVEQPIDIVFNVETDKTVSDKTVKTYLPYYKPTTLTTSVSVIKANGNVAGLVATNAGKISSCYVKGIQIRNTGEQSSSKNTTAGVVGVNSANAQVVYSYVEGTFKSTDSETKKVTSENPTTVRAQGSGIISNANISGFAYTNKGYISNCYSNIKIETNARASGFVFDNSDLSAKVESCFSLCDIENNNNAHSPFTGTTTTQVLAANNVANSFYLRLRDEDFGNTENEPAIEIEIEELESMGTFSTYSFTNNNAIDSNDENKYIWRMAAPKTLANLKFTHNEDGSKPIDTSNNVDNNFHVYPQLITANQLSLSMMHVELEESGNLKGSDVDGYAKEGATASIAEWEPKEGKENGSIIAYNPRIIANEEDYLKIIDSIAVYEKTENNAYVKTSRKVLNETLRLVSDFAFSNTHENSPSASVVFKGSFDGNGMTISNVKVNTNNLVAGQNALGFFSEINGNPDNINNVQYTYGATIKNVNFEFSEVYGNTVAMVGAVAGKVENGFLLNVTVSGNNIVAVGKNITGGVFGAMVGTSRAVNLESRISVSSEYRNNQNQTGGYNLYQSEQKNITLNENSDFSYSVTTIDNLDVISYAGGIGGVVDIHGSNSSENNAQTDIEDALVTGDVNVLGENVGGAFGLVGANSKVATIYNMISSKEVSLYATKTAGGLVAELRGMIERSKITHTQQTVIEQTPLGEIAPQANTTYFKGQTQVIGGIAGFVNGGIIKNCYSRVDVKNANALIAGGVAGRTLNGLITYTYTSGSVLAKDIVGGFVGHVADKEELEQLFVLSNSVLSASRSQSAFNFCVAANNWHAEDYSTAVDMRFRFNNLVGAVTNYATFSATSTKATVIFFKNSNFSEGTVIAEKNGKIFALKTGADNPKDEDNYSDNVVQYLTINSNFYNSEETSEETYKTYQLTLVHPVHMVKTSGSLKETPDSKYNSNKESTFERFTDVLWDGKDDANTRYLELVNRPLGYSSSVSSWNDLVAAIDGRNNANIVLKNDIIVEGIITSQFTGKINGDGHSFVFTDNYDKTKEEDQVKYGTDVSIGEDGKPNKSYLHSESVKVGSQLPSNRDKSVNQYCFGIFSLASGAWFENVHVRLEKDIEADVSSLVKGENNNNLAYIGLLVSYATDNTTIYNCKVYSNNNSKLNIIDTNSNLTTVYGGGLVGCLESSTILSEDAASTQPQIIVLSASTEQTTAPDSNGILINVSTSCVPMVVGGMVGLAQTASGARAINTISDFKVNNTSDIIVADNSNTSKTANYFGGIVGMSNSALELQSVTYEGTLDHSNAKAKRLTADASVCNYFGYLLGYAEESLNLATVTVKVTDNIEINNDNAEYELAEIGENKLTEKSLSASDYKVNVNVTYDYNPGATYNSVSDIGDKTTQFKYVPLTNSSNVTYKFDVQDNTDQVIQRDVTEEGERDSTISYMYPGIGNVVDNLTTYNNSITKTTTIKLQTYYAEGTYSQTDSEENSITKMNHNYGDKRTVLIPAKIRNDAGELTPVVSFANTTGTAKELNSIYNVFENITISGFMIDNDAAVDALKNSVTIVNNSAIYKDNVLMLYANACTNTSYEIPNTCSGIESYAFANFSKELELSVETGSELSTIKSYSFFKSQNITLTSFTGLTTISANAFKESSNITIDDATSLKTIGEQAFCNSKNINITSAKSLETIGANAFENANSQSGATSSDVVKIDTLSSLTTIGASAFKSAKNITLSNATALTDIGTNTKDEANPLKPFEYAEDVKITGVSALTKIGASAFFNSYNVSISNLSSLTEIGDNAFDATTYSDPGPDGEISEFDNRTDDKISLTGIDTLKITAIWNNAFKSVDNLAVNNADTLTLSNLEYAIGENAFKDGSFKTIRTLNVTGPGIDSKAFYDTNLTTATICGIGDGGDDEQLSIGENAFYQSSLTSLTIQGGDGNVFIDAYAFYGNQLTSLTFGTGTSDETSASLNISNNAFACNSRITELEIGEYYSVNLLDDDSSEMSYAFTECLALKSVKINKVNYLGKASFANCTNLVSVDFGTSGKFGTGVLQGCTSVTTLDMPITKEQAVPDIFGVDKFRQNGKGTLNSIYNEEDLGLNENTKLTLTIHGKIADYGCIGLDIHALTLYTYGTTKDKDGNETIDWENRITSDVTSIGKMAFAYATVVGENLDLTAEDPLGEIESNCIRLPANLTGFGEAAFYRANCKIFTQEKDTEGKIISLKSASFTTDEYSSFVNLNTYTPDGTILLTKKFYLLFDDYRDNLTSNLFGRNTTSNSATESFFKKLIAQYNVKYKSESDTLFYPSQLGWFSQWSEHCSLCSIYTIAYKIKRNNETKYFVTDYTTNTLLDYNISNAGSDIVWTKSKIKENYTILTDSMYTPKYPTIYNYTYPAS